MAINFPVLLDDLANVATGNTITPAHKNDLNDIVEALEAKVGIDSSAVTTTHDYLLTHLPAQAQNLDIGAYNLRGLTLTSDVVTGTIPIIITSTTMCTNLNANYVGGTALAGLQTVLTNSAGLLAALSDETGTGLAVFNNTPTLVTPVLGAATATTINKVTITAPAASATLTIADTKTLTVTGDATISATPYTPGGTDVALTDGGTGASTQAGAANAVLPSQTGNANKALLSDASNVSWQSINLTTMVTGTLPVGNGGTGATAAANAANGVVVLDASALIPAPQLGAWVDKSASLGAQQAATDGFVTGYIQIGSSETFLNAFTDSGSNPTTTRAYITNPAGNGGFSFCMPVKKGYYWKVLISGDSTYAVYWIPLGS